MLKNIALVTGGSSGLGLEIAKDLLQNNKDVCIIGRNKEKLDKSLELLSNLSDKADIISYNANISDEQNVNDLFKFLKSKSYKVKWIFNNAGVGLVGDPDKITRKMIDIVLEANLIGLILMSSYGLKEMSESGGTIINIMSTSALIAREKEAVYCAAKWGARGFTEALKVATKGSLVKVISVYPGGMKTPFWNKDWGFSTDVTTFMNPSDVSKKIVNIALAEDTSYISDITINRIK